VAAREERSSLPIIWPSQRRAGQRVVMLKIMRKLETPIPLTVHPENNPNPFQVEITSSMTTLVGANATGKSRLLRAMRDSLIGRYGHHKHVGYFSASRMALIDTYRADLMGDRNGTPNHDEVTLGGQHTRRYAVRSEGATRALFRLDEQLDLLLRVQTRLQHLFGKTLSIDWDSGNLSPYFVQSDNALKYRISREASGLLHLTILLTAIHDPESKALLIDEPEISLHPQYQAFIFNELKHVAGDPEKQPGKKLVIVATHSTSMIPLENIHDLPGIWFMHDPKDPPKIISYNEGFLNSKNIQAFVKTSLVRRKEVLFCRYPILVEGDSDLQILEALDGKLKFDLLASGAYPIALQGKGNLSEAMRLFEAMGKVPVAITDVDAILDTASLPQSVQAHQALRKRAQELAHADFAALHANLRNDFLQWVDANWSDVQAVGEQQFYWQSAKRDKGTHALLDKTVTQRRAALSALLNSDEAAIKKWNNGETWSVFLERYRTLLETLEYGGWFVMRGVLENHYLTQIADPTTLDKIEEAINEIATIEATPDDDVKAKYAPMVRALEHAVRREPLSEAGVVQERLLSVLAPAMQNLKTGLTEAQLQHIAVSNNPSIAALFTLKPIGRNGKLGIEVNLNSTILSVNGFPLQIYEGDNVNTVVQKRITS
jgi:AAA domain, putative AbiEii toxin, Type IV TA system